VNASVAKLLNQHKREFANAGFSLDDIFLRDDIDWCVNQLACAFAKKIAMGERYAADGVRGHKNQGYQMGSTLVEIANQRAQARLSRAVMADEDARLIPLGNERGLKLLGLVIPYVLRAVTSEMEPREEDLIEPWITVIEPQPIRMQPQDRDPATVNQKIWEQPLKAACWATPALRGDIAHTRTVREAWSGESFEERWLAAEKARAKYDRTPGS
jgi:hypothetical protein